MKLKGMYLLLSISHKRAKKLMEKEYPNGIEQCGTDALRFTLAQYTQQGRQINMDVQKVEATRRFCNKIWQAARFCLLHFPKEYTPKYTLKELSDSKKDFRNMWILSRLAATVELVNTSMEQYLFADATTAIYNFILNDFCDVFLEIVKPILYDIESSSVKDLTRDTLHLCLDSALRLLHPFMPFITEVNCSQ
jgi:valyl-tRNA synthetase